MEDEILSKDARLDDGDGMTLARDLLNTMSSYRIDPSRVRIPETEPGKRGERGVIFMGELTPAAESTTPKSGQTVAVKTKDWNHEDSGQFNLFFKSFAYELSLIKTLSHPNIAKLVGFVEDIQERDARLILPWEGNGNVQDFLRSGEWEIPERISLIQDTASGLEYLHTRQPPIRHGDLKSLHILVDFSYRAVITGFWSARIMPNVGENTKDDHWLWSLCELGIYLKDNSYTVQWAAPERLYELSAGLPVDLWALGCVCLEVVTGTLPFEDAEDDTTAVGRLKLGNLPAILNHAALCLLPQLCSLMLDCWMMDPAKRIDVSTFRKKARFLPSTTPSGNTSDGRKGQSAILLLELGRMHDLQNDTEAAGRFYKDALSSAIQTKNETVQANALIGLGGTYNARSRYSEAEKGFKEAHEIHSRIGNDRGAANALIGLGETYYGWSRYSEAEEGFKEAHETHSRIGNDLGAANALISLGETYYGRSRYSEAEKGFTEAHEIHSRIGNDLGAGNALIGLGKTYYGRSWYSEAEETFKEAHEIHSRIGDNLGVANALIGLGEVYSVQSRYRKAEQAFNDAYEIHSRIGSDRGAANASAGIGDIYNARSRYSEAEKGFKEAHEIHSRIGNDLGAANALIGLGETYSCWSRYSEAEEGFKEAHEIHSRIGNDLGAANALIGLGKTYYGRFRYSGAEEDFKEAHEIHSRIGNDIGAANALIGLGKIYYGRFRCSEAEKAFKEARGICSRIGDNLGAANALIGLGEVYSVQSMYREAEQAFKDAHEIHSRIGSDRGAANASIGLGDIYNARSRYSEAEEVLKEAREIHSRIGNSHGVAKALIGIGEVYDAQSRCSEALQVFRNAGEIHSRVGNDLGAADALIGVGRIFITLLQYPEAEKAFMEAHEIHSRVGNDRGTANASVGLGKVYNAWSRYSEAEEVLTKAEEIYSRIGNNPGVANALIGLGEVYKSQSRYSEAEKAFRDARQIHFRVGNELGVANVLIGLGEIYSTRSRYPEAEEALKEAFAIHSNIGNYVRAANAMACLGEIFDAQSKYFETEEAFKNVPDIVSRIGDNLGKANASNYSGETYDARSEASMGEEHFSRMPETRVHVDTYIGAPDSLDDSADIEFGGQTARMAYNLERVGFIQELSSLESISMPSTQYIVDLILALAKTAPTATRNKHQLYRILIISRDLCFHLHRVAHTGSESSNGLDVLEQCWGIMDNLERTLLELNDFVSQEAVPFGELSLATWNNSRTGLRRIYEKLTAHPFNTYDVNDPVNATWDRYFDDCSWMSLLLLEGIELPFQSMHPEAEEGFNNEAQNVIDRLNHLVNETKLNGDTNQPTRELFIKILSDMASLIMDGPDNLPVDFWNAIDGALQDIDLENGLNQDMVDALRDSWNGFVDRQIQQASASRSPAPALAQDPITVSLSQELTRLNNEITPAAEPLVLLLQALGNGAPTAARNKHKIYAIVSRARDICNHILAIGVRPEVGGLETLDEYYSLIDSLEGILLDIARLLPAEQVSFGREMCESWSESREEFCKILNRLYEPPFSLHPLAPKQGLTNNSVFDDHYWLSLILEEGIEKELGQQYLDIEMPPTVVSVRESLRYLEKEIKCGYHEETTRELVIDIATRLYEALSASVSKKGSGAGLPIRSAEPPLVITLDNDALVTALSMAFSVLDLDSSLESQDIHRLSGNWWGITHSLPRSHSRNRGESKLEETRSSNPIESEGQGDQGSPQGSTNRENCWFKLHNILHRRGLVYSTEMAPRDKVRDENWIVTIHVTGEDLDTLRLTGAGFSKREAKDGVAQLALIVFGEIVGEE